MIQSTKGIVFAFAISIAFSIVFPFYFPKISINFVIAPLIMLMYRASYSLTVTLALLCGLYIDCLWLSVRLGIFAASFLLTMRLIYPCRLYFFADTSVTLVGMTYLFSALSSLMQRLLALFFEQASTHTIGRWFLSDVCIMPLFDALYALVVFAIVPAIVSSSVRYTIQLLQKKRAKKRRMA